MLLWPEKSSASFYWPLAAAASPPIMPATSRRLAACSSRGLLAVTLALLSGGFQLAVAFRVDFLLTPRQHILRRDVADGTVQADVVVMLDVGRYQTTRIFQRQWRRRPDARSFERFVPASGCSRPVPFSDRLPFHFDVSPACPSTGQTDSSPQCSPRAS